MDSKENKKFSSFLEEKENKKFSSFLRRKIWI